MFTVEPFFPQIICFNTVMHIHTVTLKSHWVEKGKKTKKTNYRFPHPNGSAPRGGESGHWETSCWWGGDRLGGVVGWVRCTSMSSCSRWQSSLAVSPVWCRSLRGTWLSNITDEFANFTSVFSAELQSFNCNRDHLFFSAQKTKRHLLAGCLLSFNKSNKALALTIFDNNKTISAESNFKKDTVLFAFLWCAVHPWQCSSNTAEQLLNKGKIKHISKST